MVTVFSKIELKPDTKKRRPYVDLPGIKSSNSITLITRSSIKDNWQLINNVLPHVPEIKGQNITSRIREDKEGKQVTSNMKNSGARRKKIKIEDDLTDPKVIESQFKRRTKFLKKAG